jgi:hypothetical protein
VSVAVVITLAAGAFVIGFVERSPSHSENRYQAIFHDAGGLDRGNDVTLDGRRIGGVSAVSLLDGNAVVTFAVDASQRLGMLTTAAILPETVRETTALVLSSVGSACCNRVASSPCNGLAPICHPEVPQTFR